MVTHYVEEIDHHNDHYMHLDQMNMVHLNLLLMTINYINNYKIRN